jgi:hypothetical protein
MLLGDSTEEAMVVALHASALLSWMPVGQARALNTRWDMTTSGRNVQCLDGKRFEQQNDLSFLSSSPMPFLSSPFRVWYFLCTLCVIAWSHLYFSYVRIHFVSARL